MANSLHEVKARIEATKKTAQITKAMYMVSQSKVKKAEKTYKDYSTFMKSISDIVTSVVSKASELFNHELLIPREIKKTCYLIVTSDRGLAGSYNNGVFKYLDNLLNESHKSKDEFICAAIGKKGFNFLQKRGYVMVDENPTYIRDDVMFSDIVPLANEIIKLYLENKIDKMVIIYNHYVNSLVQEIKTQELLPIGSVEGEKINVDYIYESGIERTLNLILPMYVQDLIYGIILDAKTSEHCARVNSMRNATDNAEEVIQKLQILYNRARQEVITNELIDIIGGANAIGGNE